MSIFMFESEAWNVSLNLFKSESENVSFQISSEGVEGEVVMSYGRLFQISAAAALKYVVYVD